MSTADSLALLDAATYLCPAQPLPAPILPGSPDLAWTTSSSFPSPGACLDWGDALRNTQGSLPSQGTGHWLGTSFLSTSPFLSELPGAHKGPSLDLRLWPLGPSSPGPHVGNALHPTASWALLVSGLLAPLEKACRDG